MSKGKFTSNEIRSDSFLLTEKADNFRKLVPQEIREKLKKVTPTTKIFLYCTMFLGFLISKGCENGFVEIHSRDVGKEINNSNDWFPFCKAIFFKIGILERYKANNKTAISYKLNLEKLNECTEPLNIIGSELDENSEISKENNDDDKWYDFYELNQENTNMDEEIFETQKEIVETLNNESPNSVDENEKPLFIKKTNPRKAIDGFEYPDDVGEDEEFKPWPRDKRFIVSNYARCWDSKKNRMLKDYEGDEYLYWYMGDFTSNKDENNKHKHEIHSVVAKTFLHKPKSKERLVIDHIDGNKKNNCYKNLRYVTYSENSMAQDVQKRKEKIKEENKTQRVALLELTEVISTLSIEREELKNENFYYYEEIKELRKKISEYETKMNDINQQADNSLNNENEILIQENTTLNKQIQILDDEINNLKSKNDSLTDSLNTKISDLEKMREENNNLNGEIERLKHENKELEEMSKMSIFKKMFSLQTSKV